MLMGLPLLAFLTLLESLSPQIKTLHLAATCCKPGQSLAPGDLLGWAFFSNGIFSFGFGFVLSLPIWGSDC